MCDLHVCTLHRVRCQHLRAPRGEKEGGVGGEGGGGGGEDL